MSYNNGILLGRWCGLIVNSSKNNVWLKITNYAANTTRIAIIESNATVEVSLRASNFVVGKI